MQAEDTMEGMLRQFVGNMVEAKGDTRADQAEMVNRLSDTIDTAVLDALPDSSLEKMVALDEAGQLTAEAYDGILMSSGVDQNDVVMRAMIGFRDAYMQLEVA